MAARWAGEAQGRRGCHVRMRGTYGLLPPGRSPLCLGRRLTPTHTGRKLAAALAGTGQSGQVRIHRGPCGASRAASASPAPASVPELPQPGRSDATQAVPRPAGRSDSCARCCRTAAAWVGRGSDAHPAVGAAACCNVDRTSTSVPVMLSFGVSHARHRLQVVPEWATAKRGSGSCCPRLRPPVREQGALHQADDRSLRLALAFASLKVFATDSVSAS